MTSASALPREGGSLAVRAPAASAGVQEGSVARLAVTLGFAVAVFVRFYRLGDVPAALLPTEQAFRQAAITVIEGHWVGLWSEMTAGQPAGLAYSLAGWVMLFDDTALMIRLLSATVGLATLGLFYLFCRGLFGERAAALGSLLMALSVWHLTYSRMALPVGAMVLLALTTTYLLLLGFREERDTARRRRLLAFAGVALGSGLYFHNAFFVFVVAVVVLWAREYLAAELSPHALRRMSVGFFVPALLVATPYLGYLAYNSGEVIEGVRSVAVTTDPGFQAQRGVADQTRHVVARTVATAKALFGRGLGELLDPVTGTLAVLGMAAGAWRWRERGHFALLALAATTVIIVTLTLDSGMYGRLVLALPAVFAYAGYSLHWLMLWMSGRTPRPAAYAVVGLLLAFVALHNLTSYYRHPGGENGTLWARTAQIDHDRPEEGGHAGPPLRLGHRI